jgi:hypothetical protein
MIEPKAFRTLLKCIPYPKVVINTNIKLILHKALNRSIISYACPAWEFAAVAAPTK